MSVVLPTAFSGIMTGVLLGLARVMGETAPLLILGPYTTAINTNLFSGNMAALPTMINQDRNQALRARARPGLVGGTHPHRRRDGPQPRRPAASPGLGHRRAVRNDAMAKRIDVSGLDVFYGDFKAVEDVSHDRRAPVGDGLHRPVRLRQVDPAAHPEPDARGRARRPGRRQGAARRRGPVRRGRRPGRGPPYGRHGLPAAEPVPHHVDLRQRRGRPAAQRHQEEGRARRRRSSGRCARANLWNEVKDRLEEARRRALRRAAAAAVHRPRDRRRAAGAADGRAVLGARPDLDAGHRGPDPPAQGPTTRSSSSPTTCSRPPGSATGPRSSPSRAPASPAG